MKKKAMHGHNVVHICCDFINFEQPEIFGTQEVLVDQLHDLMKGLDSYGYIGVGRDDGKEKVNMQQSFIRKSDLNY